MTGTALLMGNKYNLLSNSVHNLIFKNDAVYLNIYDILDWNATTTFPLRRPSQAWSRMRRFQGDIAARTTYRREEIKHVINVLLQMTPRRMPLQ